MIIANYLVDSLPCDAFRVKGKHLYEGLVTTELADGSAAPDPPPLEPLAQPGDKSQGARVPLSWARSWTKHAGRQEQPLKYCRTKFAWKKVHLEKPVFQVNAWHSYLAQVRPRMEHIASRGQLRASKSTVGEVGVKEGSILSPFDRSFIFPTAALRCFYNIWRWQTAVLPEPETVLVASDECSQLPRRLLHLAAKKKIAPLLEGMVSKDEISMWLNWDCSSPTQQSVQEEKQDCEASGDDKLFIVLVTDKGHADLEGCVFDASSDPPYIAQHGSISFNVHFDVFASIFQSYRNGFSISPCTRRR